MAISVSPVKARTLWKNRPSAATATSARTATGMPTALRNRDASRARTKPARATQGSRGSASFQAPPDPRTSSFPLPGTSTAPTAASTASDSQTQKSTHFTVDARSGSARRAVRRVARLAAAPRNTPARNTQGSGSISSDRRNGIGATSSGNYTRCRR